MSAMKKYSLTSVILMGAIISGMIKDEEVYCSRTFGEIP